MDDLSHEVTTDALVSNVYFITDTQVPITTSQTKEEGLYSAYTATEQGQMALVDTFKLILVSNQCDVDDKLMTDSSKYGARLVCSFNGIKALMIVDIKRDVIESTLSSLDAGEAGKGFAVVAQEIRKLADESARSADQIARIVEEITLNTINANVTSMEEDRSATLSSISAISAISAQSAAGSANVYSTANQQLASIEELDKAADVLEKRAKELTEILEGFIV